MVTLRKNCRILGSMETEYDLRSGSDDDDNDEDDESGDNLENDYGESGRGDRCTW